MSIHEYEAGEGIVQDPLAIDETLNKKFMDKLARMLTNTEAVLDKGAAVMDDAIFRDKRGDLLDMFDDPEYSAWIDWMRRENRCGYRQYAVQDDA